MSGMRVGLSLLTPGARGAEARASRPPVLHRRGVRLGQRQQRGRRGGRGMAWRSDLGAIAVLEGPRRTDRAPFRLATRTRTRAGGEGQRRAKQNGRVVCAASLAAQHGIRARALASCAPRAARARTTGSLYADSGLAGSSLAPWHIKIWSPTATPVNETNACCTASTLEGKPGQSTGTRG